MMSLVSRVRDLRSARQGSSSRAACRDQLSRLAPRRRLLELVGGDVVAVSGNTTRSRCFVISRSAVRVRSPAPIESITYSGLAGQAIAAVSALCRQIARSSPQEPAPRGNVANGPRPTPPLSRLGWRCLPSTGSGRHPSPHRPRSRRTPSAAIRLSPGTSRHFAPAASRACVSTLNAELVPGRPQDRAHVRQAGRARDPHLPERRRSADRRRGSDPDAGA